MRYTYTIGVLVAAVTAQDTITTADASSNTQDSTLDVDWDLVLGLDPVPTASIPVIYATDNGVPAQSAATIAYSQAAAIAAVTQAVADNSTNAIVVPTSVPELAKRDAVQTSPIAAVGAICAFTDPGTATISSYCGTTATCVATAPGGFFSTCSLTATSATLTSSSSPIVTSTSTSTSVATSTSTSSSKPSTTATGTTCLPQPTGQGVVPTPDTASAFTAYAGFASSASAAPTPSGYVNTFTNLQGSSQAYGYMGYTLLSSYDTQTCATKCNGITGCQAFNVFFERDPSLDPNDPSCLNPPSTTQIKCTFWGGAVTADTATNVGQWRGSQFHVVIAGSNGYVNQHIAQPAGYSQPQNIGPASINAAMNCNGDSRLLQSNSIVAATFDAGLCAAACSAQNGYASSQAGLRPCTFFNTYILYKNNNPLGQVCAMYDETWSSSYATNTGYYYGSDHYTIGSSYTAYNLTKNVTPYVCSNDVSKASSVIVASSYQPYCSSLLQYSSAVAQVSTSTYVPAITVTSVQVITVAAPTAAASLYKRGTLAAPSGLALFTASAVTSACKLAVTPASTLSTMIVVTASPSTAVIVATSTQTVVPTSSSVTSSTSTSTSFLATSSSTTSSAASSTSTTAAITIGPSFSLQVFGFGSSTVNYYPLTQNYAAGQLTSYLQIIGNGRQNYYNLNSLGQLTAGGGFLVAYQRTAPDTASGVTDPNIVLFGYQISASTVAMPTCTIDANTFLLSCSEAGSDTRSHWYFCPTGAGTYSTNYLALSATAPSSSCTAVTVKATYS